MPNIRWDEPSKRLYETGLDRGVLYLDDSTGIPWNGLISVEEIIEETNSNLYFDGVKIFDSSPAGDFKAVLSAYTYPDEFLYYQGIESFDDSGMMITGQKAHTFGLSYRTFVGNDISGPDYGYQIHVLYNLLAVPQETEYVTYSTSPNVSDFRWSITGTPAIVDGFAPTAHVIIDSRFIDDDLLIYLEDLLYGVSDPEDPEAQTAFLPLLTDLLTAVLNFNSVVIVPDYDTGLSSLVSGYGDLTPTKIDGLFSNLPKSKLIPSANSRYYILSN